MHRHGRGLGIRPDAHQIEPSLRVLFDHLVKQRFDPDHRGRRGQKARHLPFHRAARPFGDAHHDQRLERAARVVNLGQGGVNAGLTGRIGAYIAERGDLRTERRVILAKDIARPRLQRSGGAQQNLTLDGQIGTGGPEQIARINGHLRHIAQTNGVVGQTQGKVDAFGQEILNQKGFGPQRCGIQIGIDIHAPRPARRGTGNGKVKDMPARAQIVGHGADIFHPIGAQQNGGQRQTLNRGGFAVARQGGGMHGFAGAVGAAIRGQEHIDRRRRLGPFDPTVGQVKLGVGQRQERQIARLIRRPRHDQRRCRSPGAHLQPGVKMAIALRIGHG